MFEEIAVWKRVDAKVAMRLVGFRDLETGQVWIAFANFVRGEDDEGEELSADELICAQGTLESFLDDLPDDAELWKPTISEAVAYFIANNPFE